VKTIFLTLALAVTISASLIAGEGSTAAKAAVAAGLERAVLSQDWTQCGGRFHYTFRKDGSFSLDGTLLTGSWKVEGDEMILTWTGSWIVNRVKFDAEKLLFHSDRGAEYDLHGMEAAGKLAVAG
jgi:hypothetical protein